MLEAECEIVVVKAKVGRGRHKVSLRWDGNRCARAAEADVQILAYPRAGGVGDVVDAEPVGLSTAKGMKSLYKFLLLVFRIGCKTIEHVGTLSCTSSIDWNKTHTRALSGCN